jgi:hypothetical protein
VLTERNLLPVNRVISYQEQHPAWIAASKSHGGREREKPHGKLGIKGTSAAVNTLQHIVNGRIHQDI